MRCKEASLLLLRTVLLLLLRTAQMRRELIHTTTSLRTSSLPSPIYIYMSYKCTWSNLFRVLGHARTQTHTHAHTHAHACTDIISRRPRFAALSLAERPRRRFSMMSVFGRKASLRVHHLDLLHHSLVSDVEEVPRPHGVDNML